MTRVRKWTHAEVLARLHAAQLTHDWGTLLVSSSPGRVVCGSETLCGATLGQYVAPGAVPTCEVGRAVRREAQATRGAYERLCNHG